ncbi:MAG: DMT family transporter [Candidatus Hadarchaeales archaeon]
MSIIAAFLAIGATACWGLDQVLGKLALKEVGVLRFNAVRGLFSLLFIFPSVIFAGQLVDVSLELLLLAALAGLIAEFVGVELYFHLMKQSSAHILIPIGNTDLLWGTIFSLLLLGEALQVSTGIAVALVIAGVYLLSGKGWKVKWRLVGPGLAVAILWGFTLPLSKYCVMLGMPLLLYQAVRISAATAGCAGAYLAKREKSAQVSRKGWGLSLLSGLFAFFLGFVLWLSALSLESASSIAPFLGGKVAFGFIFALFLAGERASRRAVGGAFLVFLGMLMASL